MTGSQTHVGGLPLPPALLQAIAKRRWKAPTDERMYLDVFSDTPGQALFYDVATMVRQNSKFQGWSQEELPKHLYINKEGPGITPAQAVIIGDLAPDSPIVLAYRQSRRAPKVLYLSGAEGWVEVAPDIETLLRRLGIDWRYRAWTQRLLGFLLRRASA